MKRIFTIAIVSLLLVSGVSVFAQSSGSTRGRGRGAKTYELIIRSNAKDVSIYINGEQQKGSIPYTATLAPGTYTIELKGSKKWENGSATVNLKGNDRVTINLSAKTYELVIRSNAKNVDIYINGELQKGSIPYTATLAPGAYTIELKGSKKWEDGSATVNLKGNDRVTINLKPARATVMAMKPDPDFLVFVDGKPEKQNPFKVQPGEHDITFTLGGMSATGTFNFEPGEAYRITPFMSLDIE